MTRYRDRETGETVDEFDAAVEALNEARRTGRDFIEIPNARFEPLENEE